MFENWRRARNSISRRAARRGWAEISPVEYLEERLVLTPTSAEQLFVYLLNQARHDPQAYDDARGLGGILDTVAARQPLAVNDDLFDSARFHAVEMADNNYFAHISAVTGDSPNKMAVDQGYVLPDYFPLSSNNIESIAAGNLYGNPDDVLELLIVDAGVPSLGHRKHLLGMDNFNAQAREIGVGHGFNLSSLYDHYWAAHITFSDPDDTFLTGVVYQDANMDDAFSLNEGLAGVTVSVNGLALQTQTNSAGGWSIKVPGPGTYSVTVSGGSFVGTATSIVEVAAMNREVDFISGDSVGVVDFGSPSPGDNLPPENTVPAGPLNVNEDTALAITGLSFADPDAGTANVRVTLSVAHGTLHIATGITNGLTGAEVSSNNTGTVVLTGTLAKINTTLANSAGLIYQGVSNYAGADTLTVVTSDLGNTGTGGALTDTDAVELVVAAVNDAPRNTVPASAQSVITETPLNVTGISLSDVDLDNQPAVVTLAVAHGILTVRSDVASGLTGADIAGNGTNTVTITAPLSRLLPTLAATAGVTYVSDDGYIGADTLTMTSSDQGQTGSGGAGTDIDTVAINVLPVPIAPTLTVPGSPLSGAGRAPVAVGSGATMIDNDSPNFSSGKLTIQIVSGAQSTDKLTIHKVGKKTGQLNLLNSNVRLGKTVIGTVSGGTNGSPLVIRFTSNVTPSTVQTVLQNIELRPSKSKLLAGTRTIEFVATDPTLKSSIPQTRELNV